MLQAELLACVCLCIRASAHPCGVSHTESQEPRLFGEHLEVHPIIIILSLGVCVCAPLSIRMKMYICLSPNRTNQTKTKYQTQTIALTQPFGPCCGASRA